MIYSCAGLISLVQILQNVVLQGRKLGKAVYVFSVDEEGGKVGHVNHVPPSLKEKGADARTWASKVGEVLGGKVKWTRLGVFPKLTVFRLVGRKILRKV